MDPKTTEILSALQNGLPICAQPFQALADQVGLTEQDVISRIEWLCKNKYLKRVGFSFNTHKLGLVSTLAACQIPKNDLNRCQKVIAACGNITHNYLRKHSLNMWFTVTAPSKSKLAVILDKLKHDLKIEEIISLPTEKLYKLRFKLNVENVE
ncbi:MAG: Lrp/AsnC family transcriptional regulator [Candidatus Omnitrophica bacterium]|nr:Lrp/AsnC family transcriptional regulator [Candidatus Omnitrophota bacterium]